MLAVPAIDVELVVQKENTETTKQLVSRWHCRMLVALLVGEVLFASSRKALALAMPQMKLQVSFAMCCDDSHISHLSTHPQGFTEKDIGAIASSLSLVSAWTMISHFTLDQVRTCAKNLFPVDQRSSPLTPFEHPTVPAHSVDPCTRVHRARCSQCRLPPFTPVR